MLAADYVHEQVGRPLQPDPPEVARPQVVFLEWTGPLGLDAQPPVSPRRGQLEAARGVRERAGLGRDNAPLVLRVGDPLSSPSGALPRRRLHVAPSKGSPEGPRTTPETEPSPRGRAEPSERAASRLASAAGSVRLEAARPVAAGGCSSRTGTGESTPRAATRAWRVKKKSARTPPASREPAMIQPPHRSSEVLMGPPVTPAARPGSSSRRDRIPRWWIRTPPSNRGRAARSRWWSPWC